MFYTPNRVQSSRFHHEHHKTCSCHKNITELKLKIETTRFIVTKKKKSKRKGQKKRKKAHQKRKLAKSKF